MPCSVRLGASPLFGTLQHGLAEDGCDRTTNRLSVGHGVRSGGAAAFARPDAMPVLRNGDAPVLFSLCPLHRFEDRLIRRLTDGTPTPQRADSRAVGVPPLGDRGPKCE